MMVCTGTFLEQLQKAKLLRWGQSPQPLGNSCNFSEKSSHFNVIWMTFCTFLEQLEKAKSLRGGLEPKPPAAEQFLQFFRK